MGRGVSTTTALSTAAKNTQNGEGQGNMRSRRCRDRALATDVLTRPPHHHHHITLPTALPQVDNPPLAVWWRGFIAANGLAGSAEQYDAVETLYLPRKLCVTEPMRNTYTASVCDMIRNCEVDAIARMLESSKLDPNAQNQYGTTVRAHCPRRAQRNETTASVASQAVARPLTLNCRFCITHAGQDACEWCNYSYQEARLRAAATMAARLRCTTPRGCAAALVVSAAAAPSVGTRTATPRRLHLASTLEA